MLPFRLCSAVPFHHTIHYKISGKKPQSIWKRAVSRAPDLSPVVVSLGADESCTGPNDVFIEQDTVESSLCLIPFQFYLSLLCLHRVMSMSRVLGSLSAIQGEPGKILIK